MRKLIVLPLLSVLLAGCAHASLFEVRGNQYQVTCNDCGESDWAEAAARYCTRTPVPVSYKTRTVAGLHSAFIKYRPLKMRTYQCGGRVLTGR
jgi:hypothetical protein